jgi:hypothetical protein
MPVRAANGVEAGAAFTPGCDAGDSTDAAGAALTASSGPDWPNVGTEPNVAAKARAVSDAGTNLAMRISFILFEDLGGP